MVRCLGGEVAFDADLATSVLWHLVGAPALYARDDVELVLGERGQVGVLVQVLAQQPVDVLVGTALPWV
jgi:hypothetical protein